MNINYKLKSGVFPHVNDAVSASLGAYRLYSKMTLNERQEIIDYIKEKLLMKVSSMVASHVRSITS